MTKRRKLPMSETHAENLVNAAVRMFQVSAEHIEATDMLSALASIEAAVILNVVAPHQRQMAVEDVARTASEALADLSGEWRQKMH
jgi:UDP-N-acetylmuramyl pentapeptide synthase